MKIRVSPALRTMIEAAARLNNRTLNAEISARLQWSFDTGYEADSVAAASTKPWLEALQASPLIRMEQALTAAEVRLEERIEALAEEVENLKSELGDREA